MPSQAIQPILKAIKAEIVTLSFFHFGKEIEPISNQLKRISSEFRLSLNLPVKRNEFCQRTSKKVTHRNGTPIERVMERIPSYLNQ
ncbi:MAG: hypothetical protein AAE985_06710 [Thermoplasmataceae archaeon]